MLRHSRFLFAAIALIGVTFASWARAKSMGQSARVDHSNDPIVVEGVRDRAEQIKAFVGAMTKAPTRGQLARFTTDVCPAVVGLSKHQNQVVLDRMRQLIRAGDVPLARPKCNPNALLIITDSKQRTLHELWRSAWDMFPPKWSDKDLRDAADGPSPVAAWQLEVVTGSDGRDLGGSGFGGDPAAFAVQRTTQASSRIHPPTARRFRGTVVIVEDRALDGLSTTQLADYATMRLLVNNDPAKFRELGGQTILNVIDAPMGVSVPVTATRWDLNFLTSFYKATRDTYVESQRTEIRRRMEKILDSEQSDIAKDQ